MKRTLTLLLCLALCLTVLAACGPKETKTPEATTPPDNTEATPTPENTTSGGDYDFDAWDLALAVVTAMEDEFDGELVPDSKGEDEVLKFEPVKKVNKDSILDFFNVADSEDKLQSFAYYWSKENNPACAYVVFVLNDAADAGLFLDGFNHRIEQLGVQYKGYEDQYYQPIYLLENAKKAAVGNVVYMFISVCAPEAEACLLGILDGSISLPAPDATADPGDAKLPTEKPEEEASEAPAE